MSTYGWQLVADWRALGAAERELLIGELWCLPISAIEERDDDVVAGFDTEAAARSAAAALTVPSKVIEVIDDAYLDEWRHFARPWQVEKLLVRPSWVDAAPPQLSALKGRSGRDAIEIVIDPQRTFGSGAHASTRLALALMQHLDVRTSVVLDLGCGSGVLAIAAAALGAARVEAIDVEAGAVAATIDNARRNGFVDRIDARVATIDEVADDFDVVVANVLPSVHRAVARGVRRVARRHVILAGMLDADVAEVESAYRVTRVAARSADGWTAVALRVDHTDLGS
ncbi:MAG TPA: 50S ribosomal protein L11 methyltransferase [Acidimicrobiales bacterium]|nr:50S ribosomal protein L11 methyltransferase [Acidimicrobiales bacterium]